MVTSARSTSGGRVDHWPPHVQRRWRRCFRHRATTRKRKTFHKLITDNLDWELGKEPQKLVDRLRAILKEHGVVDAPKTLDPFSGGGALPLEAERLGAEAFATELNPVAHLIELATLYYPQRFAHLRSDRTNQDTLRGRSRLVSEIERWGRLVQERASKDIEEFYRADKKDEALFYIWARTVRCSNPACHVEIPLIGSCYLIKKDDFVVALLPKVSSQPQVRQFRGG